MSAITLSSLVGHRPRFFGLFQKKAGRAQVPGPVLSVGKEPAFAAATAAVYLLHQDLGLSPSHPLEREPLPVGQGIRKARIKAESAVDAAARIHGEAEGLLASSSLNGRGGTDRHARFARVTLDLVNEELRERGLGIVSDLRLLCPQLLEEAGK